MKRLALAAAALMMATAAYADDAKKFAKAGYFVHVHGGRLWVLKEGDKDIALVSKNKEPKVVVTRIGAGPNRMTIKSNDAKVIDSYMAGK